uniref:Transient receptor potential cation channel subfamily M member 1 n=1 Tax=Magallana gigas TaxID=29159 RepID=K1PMD5_MAGGI
MPTGGIESGYTKKTIWMCDTIGRSHKKVLRKDRSRSYCVSVNWKREKSTWHIAKIHETHSLTSFSSPFSLPLDFFFQFSKHLNENDSRVSEQFTETAKKRFQTNEDPSDDIKKDDLFWVIKIMASHAELKDKNLAKSLDEHSKTFKIRALNMMDTLFQTDKKVAFNIMDNLETVWKIQATPIAFAYEFQMYDVIAHPSTVALMNKKWYRGMVPSWKQLFTKALKNPCFVFNMRCSHFVLHYILFGITLMMYSYFLLTDVKPLRNLSAKDAICEMTLYLWTTLDFINDVISVFGTLCRKVETRRHKKRKFFSRLNDMWKLFGLICFCLVIFTFSVRWKKSTKFRMVKRIAALLLLFSYLRYMRVFALRKFTGISFMFLKYMLYNLLKFLIVVAFLIIGVGVFYEALRDNSGMDMSGKWYEWSLWNILFHPFYQLFGEMFEDKFGFDGNPDKNQKTDWSVKMVAAVFMMVGNLLVISLITAFFTTTYDEVLAKSEKMWQYERYQIIMDFQDRIFANLDIKGQSFH